jgi:PPOX class probable F420-dependent enzyme
MNHQHAFTDSIATARCLSLTTFKRDGTPVATPVWFNVIDGKIYVTTPADAWKVKRIRNNPGVELATCTQRGKVTGPTIAGSARLLSPEETERVLEAKRRRYRTARLIQMLPSNRHQIGIEIIVG